MLSDEQKLKLLDKLVLFDGSIPAFACNENAAHCSMQYSRVSNAACLVLSRVQRGTEMIHNNMYSNDCTMCSPMMVTIGLLQFMFQTYVFVAM